MKVDDTSVDKNIFVSIKGKNGKVYSFFDYEKEFNNWFYTDFLPCLSEENELKNNCLNELTYWEDTKPISLPASEFLKRFPEIITQKRFEPSLTKHVNFSWDIFDLDPHLNNCNQFSPDKYPPFWVMLTYFKKRATKLTNIGGDEFYKEYQIDFQEGFAFLRTIQGYKLQSTTVKRKK